MTRPLQNPEPPETEKSSTRGSGPLGLAILGAMAIVFALIAVDVLLINAAQSAPARPVIKVVKVSGVASIAKTVDLSVSPGIKPGPGGKLHDAFSVTNFMVRAGKPVTLVIDNTDNADHSITAAAAGVNIVVRPGVHTYTLLVHKQGRFEWICDFPCDPYSMGHLGYMRGYITSV